MTLAEGFDVVEQRIHDDAYTLDITNRQGWMCPRYAINPAPRDIAGMRDALTIDNIRKSLQRAMERRDIRPTTLSLMVSKSKTLVKDLMEKNSDVQISTLVKLAGALDIGLDELLSMPRVHIVGHVGAGGQIIFDDSGDYYDSESTVMRPPGISGELMALVVRGDSMLPKYKDGDIIYIRKDHDGVLEDDLGEDCAVCLSGGGTYIKQITRGSELGRFTLRSLNAADMENQEVLWASPVLFIMPARSRLLLG